MPRPKDPEAARQGLKRLLQNREAQRRKIAWQRFVELHGPGKLTEEEFTGIFIDAYWTGAMDVLRSPVPRTPDNSHLEGAALLDHLAQRR